MSIEKWHGCAPCLTSGCNQQDKTICRLEWDVDQRDKELAEIRQALREKCLDQIQECPELAKRLEAQTALAEATRKGEELCQAYGTLLIKAQRAMMGWEKGDDIVGPIRELSKWAFRGDELQVEALSTPPAQVAARVQAVLEAALAADEVFLPPRKEVAEREGGSYAITRRFHDACVAYRVALDSPPKEDKPCASL